MIQSSLRGSEHDAAPGRGICVLGYRHDYVGKLGSASQVALSGMELTAGGAVLLVLTALLEKPSSLDVASIPAPSLAAWGYLVIAGTVVSFAAYIWLLKQVPPTLVATYTFVNPIIAVLLGWGILAR